MTACIEIHLGDQGWESECNRTVHNNIFYNLELLD